MGNPDLGRTRGNPDPVPPTGPRPSPATRTANDFYAAAVQAGTQSWKAWLFGSLDSGNAITVDKPPASLWVMVLSARIFGFSSWSLLVPQALMGVASVALLRAAVRRWAGPGTGLLAGAALAVTPAAVLMFRFDNPDALLVLLLVAATYATVRAIDAVSVRASTWWLVAAGAAVGFGFLTKMGQALLVVPAFGLVYLVAGPTRLRTRLLQLLAALGSMIVSAGWFVALVELWPADSRPYVGGSTTNSLLELALGYNGLGPHPQQPDRRVGGGGLHRDDGGRPDGLRPAGLIGPAVGEGSERTRRWVNLTYRTPRPLHPVAYERVLDRHLPRRSNVVPAGDAAAAASIRAGHRPRRRRHVPHDDRLPLRTQ
jgi:4-amino-4-deoxy-L-arabinose transferase-like glycosyltransferase